MMRPAKAIEARSDKTRSGLAVGESAVPHGGHSPSPLPCHPQYGDNQVSETQVTREKADQIGLRFLRDGGPHTLGPIESEEALAAGLLLIGLVKAGYATSTKLTPGYVQFAITDAGLAHIQEGVGG